MKMNTKNLLVFFLAIVSMFVLVSTVSATMSIDSVTVDDVDATTDTASVMAGDTVTIEVGFSSDADASDVKLKVEIEGEKIDVADVVFLGDILAGKDYPVKKLILEVPSELKDVLTGEVSLNLKLWNGDETITASHLLNVQRPAYNTEFKSVIVDQEINAGDSLLVDVILKNMGYNDLSDLYVTMSISELGVEKTSYFGDLFALEDTDEDSTMNGRLSLDIPFDAEAGIYDLEISVSNEDTMNEFVKQIVVNNDFTAEAIMNGNSLLIMNPTDMLKVYKIVFPDSEKYVTVSTDSSETVEVTPTGEEYTVSVLTMNGEVVESFTFSSAEEVKNSVSDPIIVLTVILAIVFVVLLIVLIVLIGKKPEKSEDFGESYY